MLMYVPIVYGFFPEINVFVFVHNSTAKVSLLLAYAPLAAVFFASFQVLLDSFSGYVSAVWGGG